MVTSPFYRIISLAILFKLSIAEDTLTPSKPLIDGQTLVSPQQRFELGFFSPSNSTNRYLGIWYKKTPKVVVWVANRNNPITGLAGAVRISSSGNVLVMSQTRSISWSYNASKPGHNPRAQLLDTGNFVVVDGNTSAASGTFLWQSFDYLTDTLLPAARFGRDVNNGHEHLLTSWKSNGDPSAGDSVFRFDYRGLPQLVIEMGSIRKYRTGPWNGLSFSGVLASSMISKLVPDFRQNVLYNFYWPADYMPLARVVMTPSGSVDRYLLDERSNTWKLVYTEPNDLCENYGRCGANGVCRAAEQSNCQCLNGFTPKAPQNWELPDWSDGCVRQTPLNCDTGDGFLKLTGNKLPDLREYWLDTNMNLKACETKCLSNCSCTAYANSNISGSGSGCVLWFGDLIDMIEFSQEDSKQEMYLRLPASELKSFHRLRRKRLAMAIAFPISSGVLVLCLLLLWLIRQKQRSTGKGEDLLQLELTTSLTANKEEQNEVKRNITNQAEFEIPFFSFSSVSAATNSFSTLNKLGEGGFGPVYKGNLPKGQAVAIKRLSRRSKQGFSELKNEALLMAKLQHKNLVKLLGYCLESNEQILVYEYLPNKSLDRFLFGSVKHGILDWTTRVSIIEGIAQGLLYLHQYSRVNIIHRDLKASNILLDKDMNPKISDFGMARIFGGSKQGATDRIVGTFGYMAPEYVLEGIFSVKSDVYSFGVLLLEILSGRKNTGFYNSNYLNLLAYAWDVWTSDRPLEVKDPNLQQRETNVANVDSVFMRFFHVGLLCVQQNAKDRPPMFEVLLMLSNEQYSLPSPNPPAFLMLRNPINPSPEPHNSSVNLVTSSMLEAR